MGMQVSCEDRELWLPSLQVGELFLRQVQTLEAVVGVDSGVSSPLADMIDIERAAFAGFVQQLLSLLETTNNGPLFTLAAGCTAVALALYADITGQWPDVSDRLGPLVRQAQRVMQRLPVTESAPVA